MKVLRACFTDHHGSTYTLSIGTRRNGTRWVEMHNQDGATLCTSAACRAPSQGDTGARRKKVRAAAIAAKTNEDLAQRLRVFGFPFIAKEV